MHTLFYFNGFEDLFKLNSSFRLGKLVDNFNDDVDQRISTYLNVNNNEDISSFILPISLNGNFYDFSGLIFAHHVRLSRNFKSSNVKIAFYGSVDIFELLKITPLSRILLTQNIYYFDINQFSFEDIKEYLNSKSNTFEFKLFINQIQIDAPSNYDGNHHSIDNEFALIQWSKHIGCYNSLPDIFKKEFDSRLYFKYLKSKNQLHVESTNAQLSINIVSGINILLIDDEAKAGWKEFYSSLFNKYSSKIKFEDSCIDFKDPNISETIILKLESKVFQFNPDIVLLDLRLIDSDFDIDTPPDKLTGLKILEKIKQINKGIQVVIVTASNKAWNFDLAKQKGAFDFIIKDGFEEPSKVISKFNWTIEVSSQRASFLKKAGKKLSEVKELICSNIHFNEKSDLNTINEYKIDDRIRKKMFSNLDLAFELLDLSYKIPDKVKYIGYSYLQLFLLIEDYVNPDSVEKQSPILFIEYDQLFLSHTKKDICFLKLEKDKMFSRLVFDKKFKLENKIVSLQKKLGTNLFVSSVLIYKYGNINSSVKEWTSIYSVRNKVAHEGYTPNESEMIKLIDFMCYLFDNKNESDLNIEKGLKTISNEEMLLALKQKYSKK
jgi:CheY-like chemotaxis protein